MQLEQWDAKIPPNKFKVHSVGWLDRLVRILRTAVALAFWFALHKELLTNPSPIGATEEAETKAVNVWGPSGFGWVVQEMVRFDILGAI